MPAEIVEDFLRLWPQWATALIVCLLSVSLGMVAGWTSPYLAKLTAKESILPVTSEQASWIASLFPLGRLFGAVAGSLAVEYFGSKFSLLITGVPLTFGWICIISADSAAWLYVSRIFSGSSMGMFFSCFPLYIGEISSPGIRGALVGLVINGMPLGTLIGNVMGANMSMMGFGVVSVVLNLLYMAIFPFLPESPHHLVLKDLTAKAEEAVRWYQRRSDARAEVEAVERFVRSSRSVTLWERFHQIIERKNRRAFSILISLFAFMQLSGLNSIVFYMEIILRKAKVLFIEPSSVVIIVNAIGILLGWLAMYMIDRCGRRILLSISSAGVVVAMALLGLHFILLEKGHDAANLEWLPILSLITFMLMCIGLVPVPSTMMSELFPMNLKSTAGFVGSVTSAIFAFLASKTYQPLVDVISEYCVFWVYGLIMIFCFVYSLRWVPETKGKTLQEIQEMFTRQSVVENQWEEDEEPRENI